MNSYHEEQNQRRREQVRDREVGLGLAPEPIDANAPRLLEPSVPAWAQRPPLPEEAPPDAFYGLLGEIADLTQSYVESDRTSVLAQALVTFGVAVGTEPHFMVGATRHAPALYMASVGRSSRGRKGTGWDPIEYLFRAADPDFSDRIISGIGSGEVLVHLVRDPAENDPGAPDRRLLVREPELGRLLVVVNREGSTLSGYLREMFDGKPVRNEVKGKPARSHSHQVGLVGHCTVEELQTKLREEQVRNGLANRVLWVSARRARRLASPGVFSCDVPEVNDAAARLHDALGAASGIRRMTRSPAAEDVWRLWYDELPDDDVGLVAAVTARAEAIVTRLAIVYALSDGSATVDVPHLCAAISLWDYSVACVEHIFGGTTGNPLADRIFMELADGPLFQTEISREVFGGNVPATALEEAGRLLERHGAIVREKVRVPGRGRNPLQWRRVK